MVSRFLTDLKGPRLGSGPVKETSFYGAMRCGLTPIGKEPGLPLLELLPP